MTTTRLPLLFVLVACGCTSSSLPSPAGIEPKPVALAGLHNVFRVTDHVYSGNAPEGDKGYQSLKELGIRTVVTVDGAAPDVAAAKRFGLQYVHLPIGYDGITEARLVEIAKALRDLPRPIYVHCHHGKHRAPSATIAAIRCLDPSCSAATAVNFLKAAGTDPRYAGLFAAAERTPPVLDAAKIEFREVAEIPDLTKRMVELDETWDAMKKKPNAKDAILLVEHYRELSRATQQQNEDFRRLLNEALTGAEELEKVLRDGRDSGSFVTKSALACTNCHAKFRDRRISSTP
ncbi:protein-tyrosine phosphatase family protein [Limnoglobus roseus]|uniref:Cytochrome c n=1 Tax=Limnoglobus roseus TaxID=2598579 RepID=A0A5C1AFM7_9BACT|nr:hypothetical protein [Limnoglobus roseus]QEL18229.1 hypothetical protein PX52LOC_05245 [Limnoglobus roseus]